MNLASFLTTRLCKTARCFCSGSRKEGITECDATKVKVVNNCNPYSPASAAPINSPVNMSLAPPGYYPPSGYPPDFPASMANVMDLYNSSDSSGGGGSSCGSSLVILFQAVVPPHIHVILRQARLLL